MVKPWAKAIAVIPLSPRRPDHGRGAGADEYECEGANELRKNPGGQMVLHFDLLTKTI